MDVTILYGSQTGNAEDMAKRIGYMAKSLGYRILVEAADDFQLKLLPKQDFLIFVCSTTGHGQEPENMKNFYNFIRRRDLPTECLSDLRYVVYGLGDSSYAKFNFVSKIVYKRLKECGAMPLQELVIGDEQHELGCDGVIYPKLDELWATLAIISKSTPSPLISSDLKLPENSYEISYADSEANTPRHIFNPEFSTRYGIHMASCVINKRVTSDTHFQDTRFLAFKTRDNLNYEPGDVCCILPANSDENVDQFIELLNLDPDKRFGLVKKNPSYMVNYLYDFVPHGLKVRELVKYYLDIQSVPRRSFFQFLWPLSQNEMERNKLKEFAETEGYEEMYDYCVLPKRSILEILVDFPHTVSNIKFEYIFDIIPPIKPRSFSIACSSALRPKEIQLIVGVVNYKTRLRKTRRGLCSNYLANFRVEEDPVLAKPESQLRFYVKRSSFKLPKDHKVPIIMVGPGLGIAPFRSFIEEKHLRVDQGNNSLYFGCRFENEDFYFKDELQRYANKGLIRLKVAFSRQEPKQYVQDLIARDSDLIKRLVKDENATIYVAGNSKLPEDLRSLLGKILDDETESLKNVALLESRNRIQYDCW